MSSARAPAHASPSLRPYPEYSDSGVPWLGEVPATWRLKPLWTMFRRVKRTGHPDRELLSVYRDFGVIPKASRDDNYNKPSEDLSSYQLVEARDLVTNKMKAWQGSIAVSAHVGIVSPAYHVYAPSHGEDDRYIHYLLRSAPYVSGYMQISKGIRVNQWDLEPEAFSRILVLLPTVDEQHAISAFLDRETAKIDALMAKKERLIELLQEKRTALISQAVTQGLDPNVPMKDSGVQWLGEIPAHWELTLMDKVIDPLRRLTYGIVQPGNSDPNGIYMVRGQNYSRGWSDPGEIFRVSPEIEAPYRRARLKGGDIVMTIVGAGTGNIAIVPDWLENANLTQTTARIAVDPIKGNNQYFAYLLQSVVGKVSVEMTVKGAAQPGLNLGHIAKYRVVLPPLPEQSEIVEKLDSEVMRLDALVGRISDGIDHLKEFRWALISAAVTGKIDVREELRV